MACLEVLKLFGDLNISLITDMPPGRQPIVTAIRTEKQRSRINSFLESEMQAGRQIYAVAPIIEDSKDEEVRTVTDLHQRLRQLFPRRNVALLHGKMKATEREAVMADFAKGKTNILASTTVIEVGVDVPNASVMMIENAERFGLSQLHQLRGRVGRGSHKSYCILLASYRQTEVAKERLAIMEATDDGFKIAEKDLEIRGPGDFFGTRQSGIPTLRVGNIIRDIKLLKDVRQLAFDFIASDDPALQKEQEKLIKRLKEIWQRRYGLVLIG